MKILFICKHNRFRSKVGEAIFNTLNKNKNIVAESAGILIDEMHLYVGENVIKIMKEKGYDVRGIPRRVDVRKINDYDYLIIVADNVDPMFFKNSYKGKIIWWKIKDCDEKDLNSIRERVEDIEKRVRELIKEMKNG